MAEKNQTNLENIKKGDLIEGTIIEIKPKMIFVDIPNFGTGAIYGKEIKESRSRLKEIKIGDPITAMVIDPENEEGFIELSLKLAAEEKAWEWLENKMASRQDVEAKITEANRGGLIVDVNGVSGFLPVSQLNTEHYPRIEGGDKEKILSHLSQLIGKTLITRVLDFNQRENKLIVSEKSIEDEKIKEVLKHYKEGDIVEGEITGIVDFGVFVKFKPKEIESLARPETLEGLIHISELDWQLIKDPHDIVKVGEKIKAKIIDISNERISLSLKALKENPWESIEKKYKVGDTIKGKVVKISPYGAFVEIERGIKGLAHISDFQQKNLKMEEKLEAGKTYSFKIILMNTEEYKIALSFEE